MSPVAASHSPTRRQLLGAGALTMSAAAIRGVSAQQPSMPPSAPAPAAAPPPAATAAPRAKGPLVWLDMDQVELDGAYDQSKYAPNIQQVLKRYAMNSDGARARVGAPRRHPYGPSPIEALDVYVTDRPRASVNIFLHGGAWRTGEARNYAFAAELFVRAGAHLVVPDFISVIEAGGNLMLMAEQVRRAVGWVYRNAASFGGDPSRIYLSGHSSGAHLTAVALTTDWKKDHDLPTDVVKGAMCCSGPYDLKAPRLSARSNYVKFTDEIEQLLSPPRHVDRINAAVIVVYGSLETPEFQRQGRDFAATLKAANKPVRLIVGDEYNHFEIIETMANPYGIVGRAVLEQMKLA
jgi:arylformamidase